MGRPETWLELNERDTGTVALPPTGTSGAPSPRPGWPARREIIVTAGVVAIAYLGISTGALVIVIGLWAIFGGSMKLGLAGGGRRRSGGGCRSHGRRARAVFAVREAASRRSTMILVAGFSAASGRPPAVATIDLEDHLPNHVDAGFPKISAPARRALSAAGYMRLDQLARVSESDLTKLHGVGPAAIVALRAALAERGLSFHG